MASRELSMRSQSTWLTAVQTQVACAETKTERAPPVAAMLLLAALNSKRHGAPA